VIRLDRAMPKYRAEDVRAPDARFTVELLEDALRAAAAAVTVTVPAEVGGGYLTWGAQLDVQHIGTTQALEPSRFAGYLAKYATKATEQAGGVLHRDHVRAFMREAFVLDGQVADRKLGRNAHNFGYRGHCLTKSRRYSTTFKQLRADREAFVHEQLLKRSRDRSQLAIAAAPPEQRRGRFDAVGFGHFTTVEDFLAEQGRAREREARRIAREELCDHPPTRRGHRCETPQRETLHQRPSSSRS
jgi:Replication initiator protein, pSAM2